MAAERNSAALDTTRLAESSEMVMSAADKRSKKRKKTGQIISISQGSSAKSQRRKRNPFTIFSVLLLTTVLAGVATMMVHFSAELNEINDQITSSKAKLAAIQEEATRYQIDIDKVLTNDYVKNYAETKLHMTPVKNAQKQFVFMASGDEGKIMDESKGDSVFTFIQNAFNSTFM